MKKTSFLICISLSLLVLSVLSCLKKDADETSVHLPSVEPLPPEVVVSSVKRGPIYKTYTSIGTVTPKDSSRIFPKVGGRISKVCVEEGHIVNKGDLLMQIDAFDYTRAVENATALKNQAASNLEKAKRDFSRIEKLYADKAVPKKNLQDMKTALDLAVYAYDQAAVSLKKAVDDFGECGVRAPISGMVTAKLVNPGELIGPQTMAFKIMQMETVEVEVDLPEEAFGNLSLGNKGFISFDAVPDKSVTGTITKIHPTIDPVSRTVKITLSIDNPNLLIRSGMTARTRIVQTAEQDALYAARAALIPVEDRYIAYRVQSGRVERILLDVGIIGDDVFEIKNGAVENDLFVVRGVTGLRNGMKVKIVHQDTVER
ncbi:MAG: efflux RND transporter periplasmic adaptor subunit [Desulfobacterales bacterium]